MFNKGSKRRSHQETKNTHASKSFTRIVISILIAAIAWIGATSVEAYLLSDKNVTSVVVATQNVPEDMLINDENRNQYFTTKSVNSNLVTKINHS